jgi:type IV pilus assembly protein PilQ
MKKYLSKIIPVLIILWVVLYGVVTGVGADQHKAPGVKNETANVGYLENILFERLSGREKVILVVSQQPVIAPPSLQADNSLLIRLENLYAPDNMREPLRGMQSLNVTGVSTERRTAQGKSWVYLKINLKENTPYSIRPEGNKVIIDFNVSALEAKSAADRSGQSSEGGEIKKPARSEAVKRYTDRIISIDFQDAEIKSVLRLMAEYGNISIISGDDVKGNVTLTMKSVPWEQALDSILDIKGLAKKQAVDVITVMTLAKQKKDEADKKAAEEDKRKTEDERKAREQQSDIEKGKLRQIMIEAKIVEASDDFIRNLGIQWGVANNQNIGGDYGLGISAGTNPFRNSRQNFYKYPDNIAGIDRQADVLKEAFSTTSYPLTMAAVNMPTAILGPTLGLVFGGAHGFIETQLSAMESTTQGKIISAPKVVTMDNVKAMIRQGEEVPYVTPATPNTPATVAFKDALLRLEVKPKITDDNRISMDIKATNDRPDYTKVTADQPNPAIVKNEVESKVVVRDGDTVVIGGISKNDENKTVAGVPWFYKIPVLGWLFKTENITKQKRQLLIFITPKILSESGYIEDECDTTKVDNLDRCPGRK